MPRVLSSQWTPWYKFVLPSIWMLIFGIASIAMLRLRPPGWPVFPIAWVLGSILWYWACIRLKKVTLDQNELILSNYSREIRVPLSRVTAVKATRMVNPPHVTLTFDGDIGFGQSVTFMPALRWRNPFQEHPIAQELRELVDRSHQS